MNEIKFNDEKNICRINDGFENYYISTIDKSFWVNEKNQGIFKICKSGVDSDQDIYSILADKVSEKINDSYGLRFVLIPEIVRNSEDGSLLLKINYPKNYSIENTFSIQDAIFKELSLPTRIKAAVNIATVLNDLEEFIPSIIKSLPADSIMVNIKTGEVYIDVINCFDEPNWMAAGDFYRQSSEVNISELISKSAFRLVCLCDPYDGSKALVDYPCISNAILNHICGSDYDFIFAPKSNNKLTKYSPSYAKRAIWEALPLFIREEFINSLAYNNSISAEEWMKLLWRLRDCLVSVNKRFGFVNPTESGMYISVGDYSIPVSDRKAIYWYHIGVPFDPDFDGIIATISMINGEYVLNNYSKREWDEEGRGIFVEKPSYPLKSGISLLCKGSADTVNVFGTFKCETVPETALQSFEGEVSESNE